MIPTNEEFEGLGGDTYSFLKVLPDGEVAWCARLMFTTAILYGWREAGYADRWCYETLADARRALMEWEGAPGTEPDGWHRHPSSGRRRDLATGKEWVQP
jgi:hypothetical protein